MDPQVDADARDDDVSPSRRDFVAFYESAHADQVRRAYMLVRSNEQANDIVHDAMVGVWRRWPLENPAGYLNRAVLNGCRDAARRQSSHHTVVGRLRPTTMNDPPSEHLDDVLAGLPFNQRAAVVLRYYCGWSTQEIAEALACPANSIGPWISRALAQMRKELA